jgi:predicted XRE-type DNA-binding protein
LRQPATAKSYPAEDLEIGPAYTNVWDAIEDDPAEAARLTILSDLMTTLEEHIKAKGWTQKEAADLLGTTQPRISDLMRGKINVFSIDSVLGLLTSAGLHVEVSVREAA